MSTFATICILCLEALLLGAAAAVGAAWFHFSHRKRQRTDAHVRDLEKICHSLSPRQNRLLGAGAEEANQRTAAILGSEERQALGLTPDGEEGLASENPNRKLVLIADDDFDVGRALTMRLKQIGVDSMRTSDAMHALIGIHKVALDLIIMDVNMPSGNGLAVCEMLATDLSRVNIPIIVYSGCSDERTITRCRELHLHYVHKAPGSWDRLRVLISDLLGLNLTELSPQDSAANEMAPPEKAPLLIGPTAADNPIDDPADSVAALPASPATASSDFTGKASSRLQPNKPLPEGFRSKHQSRIELPSIEPAKVDTSKQAKRIDREPQNQQSSPTSEGAAPYRVLVIDDDPDISRALGMRLAGYGIEVIRTFSGLQGFWTGLDQKPDLIITDMNMPDGEGNYIVGRFKSHPLTKDIPIIVLTGQDNAGLQRLMLNLGVSAYLKKPIVLDDLLHQLRQHVDLPSLPAHASVAHHHEEPHLV